MKSKIKPVCQFSKQHATRCCVDSNCRFPAFICKYCENKQCINLHKHANGLKYIKWQQIQEMAEKYLKNKAQRYKNIDSYLSKQIEMIINDIKNILNANLQCIHDTIQRLFKHNSKNNQDLIFHKIQTCRFNQITGQQMSSFYGFLQSKLQQKLLQQQVIAQNNQKLNKVINILKADILTYINKKQKKKPELIEGNFKIQQITKQIEIYPLDPDYYITRAAQYIKIKKFNKAQQDYNFAIKLNPKYAIAYYRKGNLYHQLNKFKDALENYNKAIQINPKLADVYISKGLIFQKLNRIKDAQQNYSKSLQLSPNNQNLLLTRALLYRNSNRINQSLEDYSKAIQLNPLCQDAYYNRALIYQSEGRFQEAIRDYTKILQMNPKNEKVYNNRGTMYYNIKNYKLAQQDFKKAIKMNPQQSSYYENIGLVYRKLNKIQQAKQNQISAALLKQT